MKSADTQQTGGITALDDGKGDKPAAGGVFRLDSLSPGAEGAAGGVKRRLSLHTVMLGCLLVGGAGLLYAMRLVGIGPLNSFAALTKLNDYELAKPGQLTADHKKVLDQLSNATATPTQVPADQVQKNPFEIAALLGEPAKDEPSDNGAKQNADRARQSVEARKRRIETAYAGLKLNGVIGGSRPVARISGDPVRVGDTVADVFKVVAISGRGVELEADGKTYTLSMDAESTNSNRKK